MSAVDVVKTGTPHVQYGAWLTSAQTRQRERPDQRYSGWALVCWWRWGRVELPVQTSAMNDMLQAYPAF